VNGGTQSDASWHSDPRRRLIPEGPLNLFNKTAWPVIAAGPAGVRDPSQGVRVDAGARMRGM